MMNQKIEMKSFKTKLGNIITVEYMRTFHNAVLYVQVGRSGSGKSKELKMSAVFPGFSISVKTVKRFFYFNYTVVTVLNYFDYYYRRLYFFDVAKNDPIESELNVF